MTPQVLSPSGPAVTRSDVVREARTCLGTPFHHQGRQRGVALDCAGLLLHVSDKLGLPQHDYPRRSYSRFPLLGRHLYYFVAAQTTEIKPEEARPGSLLMFWIVKPDLPQHLGIVTEPGRMIHAWSEAKAVIEVYLGPYWDSRLYAAFDFRGVA